MAAVYLGVGSNLDPEVNLRLGIDELRRRFGELELSSVYRNAAVGFEGPDFLNLVVHCETTTGPLAVHSEIEVIHETVGRRRGDGPFESRPLDIDLLLYGDCVIPEGPLRIPRADILEYSFVLRPLAELAPDLVHPLTGKTMKSHWRDFDAGSHELTPVPLIL